MKVGSLAAAEAQRILDSAARRLLAPRLDRDPVGAAAGTDDRLLDHGDDQGSPFIEGENVPIPGANGDGRHGGGE